MLPYIKCTYSKTGYTDFDLTPYLLNIQVSKGTEAKKNSVTIELQNHDGLLNSPSGSTWEIDQSTITLYLDWQPIDVTTTEPVMIALVSSLYFLTDNNGKYKIKVKSTDKTGLFLSKLWAQAYIESEGWSVSVVGQSIDSSGNASTHKGIINNLIGHVNNLDGDVTNNLTTNNVATVKSDGSSFPTNVAVSKVWKPIYEWLNDLSDTTFTNEDRPYVYYVDANNDLHWHYPYQKTVTSLTSAIDSTQVTINVSSTNGYPLTGTILIDDELIYYSGKTSTSFTGCTRGYQYTSAVAHDSLTSVSGNYLQLGKQSIYKMDIETTEEQTYNFIIYNAGEVPDGYEYLYYHLDQSQIGKKFKMKFMEMKSLSDTLYQQERLFGVWGTDKTTRYPKPNDLVLSVGNPYTMTFRDINGSQIVVTSNSEYNDAFELQLQRLAEAKCESYFRTGQQKYKATIQMRGTTEYEPNEIVSVISPKFEQTLNLRIKDIKHQLNKGSWITDIEAESDPSPQEQ